VYANIYIRTKISNKTQKGYGRCISFQGDARSVYGRFVTTYLLPTKEILTRTGVDVSPTSLLCEN